MKTLTTTCVHIAIAVALTGGLAACNDKPATTTANASAPPQETVQPASDQTPTARELAAAPRDTAPQEGAAAATTPAGMPGPSPAATAAASPDNAAANDSGTTPRYATVVSVQPVKQKVSRKREECRDERVVHRVQPKDDHQVAGTVIGAVAGGVLGNQVGHGRGRKAATVAGALGGGYAGKKIQQNQQRKDTYTTVEQRCRTVDEPGEEVVAYDVVYEYLGTTQKVRLDHDPGQRIELPVRGIE